MSHTAALVKIQRTFKKEIDGRFLKQHIPKSDTDVSLILEHKKLSGIKAHSLLPAKREFACSL